MRGTDTFYVDTSVLVTLSLTEPHRVAVVIWCAPERGELIAAASSATRRSGGASPSSTQHSPSVMRWKITTHSALGSRKGAAASACGDW